MATKVCVGNRQGGVGKSTVTMMLAHALAVLGKQRVLVIDLDTQCNSSYALIGSARLRTAFDEKTTLSDYMGGLLRGRASELFNSMRPFGMIVLYALLISGVLWQIVGPIQDAILDTLL